MTKRWICGIMVALAMCLPAWGAELPLVSEYSAGIVGGEDTVGLWGRYGSFGMTVGSVNGESQVPALPVVAACKPKPRPKPQPPVTPQWYETGDSDFLSVQWYTPIPGFGKCYAGTVHGGTAASRRISCRLAGFVGAGLSRIEEVRGTDTRHEYDLQYNGGVEYVFPVGLVLRGGYDSLTEGFVGIGWGMVFKRR